MWKKVFHIDHVIVTGLVLGLIYLFQASVNGLSFFDPVKRSFDNFSLKDVYYQAVQEQEEMYSSNLITIVDMSSAYRRDHLASVIEDIAACKPAVLGVDIVFEGWREDTLGSELLAEVVRQTENTVFAFKLKDAKPKEEEDGEWEFTKAIHPFFADGMDITEGFTKVDTDMDGRTLRMFPISRYCNGEKVYSFTAQVAEAYQGGIIGEVNEDDRSVVFSNSKMEVVHCDSVREHCDLIKDRIVLLGAMKDDYDKHYTPIGRIPGVEFLAYSVQTLLEHNDIRTLGTLNTWIISILIIYLTLVLRVSLYMCLKRSGHPLAAFITDSSIGFTVLTFLWLCLIVILDFFVFVAYDIYINPLVLCVGVAFIGDASALYEAGVNYLLRKRIGRSFLRHSVYYIPDSNN